MKYEFTPKSKTLRFTVPTQNINSNNNNNK